MSKYTWKTSGEPVYKILEIKPNYNIRFHNADNVEVGVMDFSGGSLSFEGNAEESAIVFMNWINQAFQQRLKEEYDKGFKDGKDFTQNKTSG
jgi:hypothetical protein